LRTLIEAQSEAIEAVLWEALKALNEQHNLLGALAEELSDSDDVNALLDKSKQLQAQAHTLRSLIEAG
jgi:hypothetical protein